MDATPKHIARREGRRAAARSTTGIFVLGLFCAAYVARAIVIPIALALMLSFLLAPLVRNLSKRLHLPQVMLAPLVVAAFMSVLVVGALALSSPASEWADRLPTVIADVQAKLRPIGDVVDRIQGAAKQVEDIAKRGAEHPVSVAVEGPGLARQFLDESMTFFLGGAITLTLLLFLVASNESTLRQAIAAAPRLTDKKRIVEIVRQTEEDISHYLISITIINTVVGLLVWGAMSALSMPDPGLWGALAGILNFVPFVGAAVTASVIGLIAISTFDSALAMLAPPLTFLGIHLVEGQIATPLLLSRRLLLSPIAVLLSLIFWTWLWGIPGTLLAVPLLATFKIICEHVEPLAPLAVLLTKRLPAGSSVEQKA